ncbi:hypothetical protein [Streptomyces hiroshimensis]|uniref:L-2-amino-thiazoline-4-carboxylic acid hydrolase n=1 Tax=Streptomyces hiroshimensis TaxID=66424 RepID=A0ABQ2YCW0_9ACTN|nr:hypothetical protein [Streptomyces hiroshimensis]GGX78092.1 hypothetical protein GCM10010324_24530 [Streptomyces hiroshimensis]
MTEINTALVSAEPTEADAQPGAEERTALWKRRLFEAEAGLTRFVVEARAGAHMQSLLKVKNAIFESLPESGGEQEWKAAFFRGQALMEQFLVGHFGHDELATWAASNSTIYAAVDSAPKHDAVVPLQRLDAQAGLYDSDTEWVEDGADRAVLNIRHCAIWDYRELARKRGVTITLQSPCEYCVPATTAMITSKGLNAAHELTDGPSGKGCVWTASRKPCRPAQASHHESEG